mmetsp:Transcript_116607/g.326207  ORF Transcript_116607/g.326207 Transcript_116607/m.326207 type:complete len:217 (+) Transcript_116607:1030-1680(+)
MRSAAFGEARRSRSSAATAPRPPEAAKNRGVCLRLSGVSSGTPPSMRYRATSAALLALSPLRCAAKRTRFCPNSFCHQMSAPAAMRSTSGTGAVRTASPRDLAASSAPAAPLSNNTRGARAPGVGAAAVAPSSGGNAAANAGATEAVAPSAGACNWSTAARAAPSRGDGGSAMALLELPSSSAEAVVGLSLLAKCSAGRLSTSSIDIDSGAESLVA